MFEKQIREFDENISLLRLFVEDIKPVLISKREEVDQDILPLYLAGLRNTIRNDEDNEDRKLFNESIDELLVQRFGEKVEVIFNEIHTKPNFEDGKLVVPSFKIVGSKTGVQKIFRAIHKFDNQIKLLYRSSLISLLSSSEWFFSQILHQYYSKHPKAAGIESKTLTLNDLKTFGSIEDAESFLIESKIEGILRSGFDDWMHILENEVKLGLGYLKDAKLELFEIYQRRNVIIHNGGIVNSIYLSKVDKSLTGDFKIGDLLEINEEYLDRAICIIHKTFILIAAELWKSLEPENTKRADTMIDITYENLLKKNWLIAEGLSYFICKDAKMGPVEKSIGQLNYWLSKKRMDQWDNIKDEVKNSDYSDKKNILRLGFCGLKEEIDEFLQLLPLTIQADEITPEKVMEFPIFEEIRSTEEFKEFILNSEYFVKYRTNNIELAENLVPNNDIQKKESA